MHRRFSQPTTTIAETFAGAKADYAAMTESRFRRRRPGVGGAGGAADQHYRSESAFVRMREYVRAMIRDDACAKFLVQRALINVIRTGFAYEPDTGDKGLDRELKGRWRDWANDPRQCDAAGVLTFPEIERLTAFNEIVDGDLLHAGTADGAIQTYEADRCCSPRRSERKGLVHGILLDERRRPAALLLQA